MKIRKFSALFLFFAFCFSSFLSSFLSADLASDTVYLTWQRDPTTTMTVQWISDLDNEHDTLSVRPKGEQEWHFVVGTHFPFPHSSKLLMHSVELTKLKPYTDYEFKMGEDLYLFRTMPTTLNTPIRFVEGGDMFHDGIEYVRQTCLQAAKRNPDFAVIGGDIAYAVGHLPLQNIQRWIDWVINWHQTMVTPEKRMVPVVAAIGNHDLIGQYNQSPAQAKVFSALFPLAQQKIYNVLDFSNYLSLFLLDSGHATPVSGAQSAWLKASLEQRQEVKYRFATYHVPAYTSARAFNNTKSLAVRTSWVPLFDQGHLNVAFEHHDHAYKRTFPLLNNKVNPKGVIYIGDGAWGTKKPRKAYSSYKKPFYLAKFASKRHFILVTLKDNGYQLQGIDPAGEVIDNYEGLSLALH